MQNVENVILNKPYQVQTGVPVEHSYLIRCGEREQALKITTAQNPTLDFNDSGWSRFHRGMTREIIVKLDEATAISGFSVTFLQDRASGIYSPYTASLAVSEDGMEYMTAFTVNTSVSPSDWERKTSLFEVNGDKTYKASYVRLTFNLEVFAFACNFKVFGGKLDGSELPFVCDTPKNYINEYKYGEDGYNSTVIIYCGYWNETMNYGEHYANNGVEAFLPYAAYVDRDGKIVDTMFDSIVFLALQSRNPSGGNSVFHYNDPDGYTVKEDFDYFIDNIFQDDFNMGALDKALDIVKEQLNMPEYKMGVSIQIPFPHKTNELFGIIDGVEQYSRTVEERKAVAKYFVDTAIARFNEKGYKNLTLTAFYQGCESVPFASSDEEFELFKAMNAVVREAGYKSTWIPLYLGTGFDKYAELGFDYAYMQPNYMFHNWERETLDEFAKTIYRYGLGSEIEINYSCVNAGHENYARDREKYLDYLRSGVRNGYMQAANAYYQGAGPGYFYTAAYSDNDDVRLIYDKTYQYIKKTLVPSAPVLKDEDFKVNKRGQIVGSVSVSVPKDDIFGGEPQLVIVKNPEQGLLHLDESGKYIFTPYYNFKGSDSFTLSAERDGIMGNEITVTVDITEGKIKPKLNEQSQSVLKAKRILRKAEAHKKTALIVAAAGAAAALLAISYWLKDE